MVRMVLMRRQSKKELRRSLNGMNGCHSKIYENYRKKSDQIRKISKLIATGIETTLLAGSVIYSAGHRQPRAYVAKSMAKEKVEAIKNKNKPFFGDFSFDLEEYLNISDKKTKEGDFHEIGFIIGLSPKIGVKTR